MDRESIFFCAGSLVVSVALAWICFPLAALDRDTVEMAKTPQPAEVMPDIDVGGGFGKLPAIELIGYYVENPPAVSAAAAAPEIKFGGC